VRLELVTVVRERWRGLFAVVVCEAEVKAAAHVEATGEADGGGAGAWRREKGYGWKDEGKDEEGEDEGHSWFVGLGNAAGEVRCEEQGWKRTKGINAKLGRLFNGSTVTNELRTGAHSRILTYHEVWTYH
jgi:hypothetical protein